ncbi:unnamed protein product [Brassica oleracea var. botrytis]|uniref:(rape) hypothetical protein n=1 Tax=Brassica napus TaxID=3708 RepID=A0A816JD04_BRANA|nr:unnamed protein product [Brassica napus]
MKTSLICLTPPEGSTKIRTDEAKSPHITHGSLTARQDGDQPKRLLIPNRRQFKAKRDDKPPQP